jgi:group I intron endonuclease
MKFTQIFFIIVLQYFRKNILFLSIFFFLLISILVVYIDLSLIITLSLWVNIVADFFGREVGIKGMQFNVLYVAAYKRDYIRFNRVIFKNHNLLNKVYFSTSCVNLNDNNNLNPEVIYINADINKEEIIKENKNKSGVYRWTNLNTGFMYVGSSVNLAKRLSYYYNFSSLTKKNMIIYKAILKYGYSNFKLDILEYCVPEECIKREQYYLDLLKPEYNILKTAGSTLGYKHTEETLAKFKERKFTPEHLAKLKAHLIELNQNQSEEQRLGAKERMLRINMAKGIKVEVTDLRTNEIIIYDSLRKTAEALNTDLKALGYNEKVQKERGKIVPFKKYFVIKIKR